MELAPSFTIIFSCPLLSQRKISSPCTSPRLSSEFCRTIQFSNCLVVCHYHDFSPKQIRSREPFLIQYICFSYMIASSCQKPIRYVGCIFILLNDNRVICNLVAAVQLAKQIAQQFPIRFVSKGSFDKLKLYFLDGFLQLVVLIP